MIGTVTQTKIIRHHAAESVKSGTGENKEPNMPKSKKTYSYKDKDGQKLKAVIQWIPACMGAIGHINLYEGEKVITVFMSGGHYLNWLVVKYNVDDAFQVIQGQEFLDDRKKNWCELQAAVKKLVGDEAWEAIKSEFPDDESDHPDQFA